MKEVQHQVSHNGVAFFRLQADEVRNVSIVERLGVVIRYITENSPLEKLIQFVECQEVAGAAICQKLIGCLEGLKLNPDICRTPTHDGAGKMVGDINGYTTNFKQVHPRGLLCSPWQLEE